jgi:alpha-tubulin suppressor-like RCC1 family protein
MKRQVLYICAVILSQTLSSLFPANARALKISTGVYHSLAICSNGNVMGWGNNMFGELGNETNASGTAIILDINGKELMQQHTFNGYSKVNTSILMPGFYVLSYREAGKSVNIKLIKF